VVFEPFERPLSGKADIHYIKLISFNVIVLDDCLCCAVDEETAHLVQKAAKLH